MITALFIQLGLSIALAAPAPSLIRVPVGMEDLFRTRGITFTPDHFSSPEYRVGYVAAGSLSRLPASARVAVKPLDELRWAAGGYDRKTFAELPVDLARFADGYHDYDALTAELKSIRDEYPAFVRLETAGQSVQGRELWYLVVSDKIAVDTHKPKIIYHANMHGDEVVGRELMIYLARHLLEQFGKDPKVTQILSNSTLYIMPSMNPDGFELHRRSNANGKDLNRNFPDRFDDPSDTPDGREIEVQHMMELARANHFVYGINWHGGEITFNLPWGNISNAQEENKYGDDWFFYPIGREYTEANEPMYANHHSNFDHGLTYGYEWYPVSGGINDWYNFYRRSVHAVVELTVTKWPSAGTLPKHWDDNRDAMITHLTRGLRGLHLDVRDAAGKPIKLPTIALASSPKRPLTFDDGWIHRVSGDGEQEITVSAEGFAPRTFKVLSTYFDGKFTQVKLERN
jgi:carboxypeptidase D